MAQAQELCDASGLVDPGVFPFRTGALGLDWTLNQVDRCRRTGHQLAEAALAVHTTWSGLAAHYQAPEAPDVYRAMDPIRGASLREQEVFDDAAAHLRDYGEDLSALDRRLADVEAEATTFRRTVARGVWVTPADLALGVVLPDLTPTLTLDPGGAAWAGAAHGRMVPWSQHRPSLERNRALLAEARTLTEQIREAGQRLARRLSALDQTSITTPMGPYTSPDQARLAEVAGFAPTQAILDGGAEEVRQWWDTLTPEQRQALITTMPMVIGNLNGVPLQYRAEANQINIRTEIDRLRDEIARLDQEIAQQETAARFGYRPYGWGVDTQSDTILRLREQREAMAAAIASYEGYLNLAETQWEFGEDGRKHLRTSVEVVAFDPATSTIATYHGPYDEHGDVPTWIKNLAIHVPGTKTQMEKFNGTDSRAYDMYEAAYDPRRGAEPTAILAWAGGDFPQLFDAAWDGYSRDLGPKLRDFAAAVDTDPAGSTLTVTGHSYGGAVVGQAEAAGLEANRVLYVAGAGLGNDVDAVADYPRTSNVPHYALMARNDSIVGAVQAIGETVGEAGSLGHGDSALDDPDVIRLESGFIDADHPEKGDIESLGGGESHSGVYTVGSTAFNNIVGAITGTEVEAFAASRRVWVGNGYVYLDGIDAADYVPDRFNVTDRETSMTPNRQEPS